MVSRAERVRALEVDHELGYGVIDAQGQRSSFWSFDLDVNAALGKRWLVRADASLAHYLATDSFDSASILWLGCGAGWKPLPHLQVSLELHGALPHTFVQHTGDAYDPTVFYTRSHSLGGALSASYDLSLSDTFDLAIDSALGSTRHDAHETDVLRRLTLWDQRSGLWQFAGTLASTLTIAEDTDVTLTGSVDAYHFDGALTVSDGFIASDGLPLEPMLYALRLAASHDFGVLEISAHGQYAGYAAKLGHSWNTGIELELTLSDHVSIGCSGLYRRAAYSDGVDLSLYMASLSFGLEF
jgi:hypothetical protein